METSSNSWGPREERYGRRLLRATVGVKYTSYDRSAPTVSRGVSLEELYDISEPPRH